MKMLMLLMAAVPTLALAEPYTVERVLKDSTTIVALDLNSKTVFCTNRGYGTVQLKISVPDLDWLAHFDHRVVGETLPCITGGECSGKLQTSDIIDPKDPTTLVPVRVILKDIVTVDEDLKTCTRHLEENIQSVVRGRVFNHQKDSEEEPLALEKCRLLLRIR